MKKSRNTTSNRGPLTAAITLLLGCATLVASAQANEKVTTWWPDVKHGIVWTGTVLGGWHTYQTTYDQAVQACSTLTLDGMTGWRLPTIDELSSLVAPQWVPVTDVNKNGHTYNTGQEMQVAGMHLYHGTSRLMWTSTPSPNGKILTGVDGASSNSKPDSKHGFYCVRTMESEIADVAKQAQPWNPVASLQELRNLIPLRQAYDAYAKHDYVTRLTDAQAAAAVNPKSAEAIYAEGLSQAGLGDWAEALADFKIVKKMNWDSMTYPIAWAQSNEKAAASGKTLNPKKNAPPNWPFGG